MWGFIGFVPWIAYAVIATSDEWRWGAIAGLVIAVVLVIVNKARRKGWDQMVIETSAVVFFALLTAYSLIQPDSEFTKYGPALVDVWLAITAWGSLAVRKPFTLPIARTMAPEEVWHLPLFYRMNAIITGVWAASFTLSAIALGAVLAAGLHVTALVVTVKVASIVIPVIFTIRYPQVVRARAERTAQANARR